ncbi:zinc finger domain-containing protein [Streptomyces sp. NPDC002521]
MPGEFTHHAKNAVLGRKRAFHGEVLDFLASHPDASLADFEQVLRKQVEALQIQMDADRQATVRAVVTKPLAGPLADPDRQDEFGCWQVTGSPSGEEERRAWWQRRAALLEEIKEQACKDALDWECRACGALVGQQCRTAGGQERESHFLRVTDAELPYLKAYGIPS